MIFFILIFNTFSRNIDYEISRARKTWTASHRAVHYTDNILLLSQELDKGKGIMTSFSPFVGGLSWSLTLSIAVEGEIST